MDGRMCKERERMSRDGRMCKVRGRMRRWMGGCVRREVGCGGGWERTVILR